MCWWYGEIEKSWLHALETVKAPVQEKWGKYGLEWAFGCKRRTSCMDRAERGLKMNKSWELRPRQKVVRVLISAAILRLLNEFYKGLIFCTTNYYSLFFDSLLAAFCYYFTDGRCVERRTFFGARCFIEKVENCLYARCIAWYEKLLKRYVNHLHVLVCAIYLCWRACETCWCWS